MAELACLKISAWSDRARFALDICKLEYVTKEQVVMLSELLLRVRLNNWNGKITFPILFRSNDPPLTDGLAIAQWASRQDGGVDLFPAEHEEELQSWIAESDELLDYHRYWISDITATDKQALLALLPQHLNGIPILSNLLASLGIWYFRRKYKSQLTAASTRENAVEESKKRVLRKLNSTSGTNKYLVGDTITFADLSMATAIGRLYPTEQTKPYQFIPPYLRAKTVEYFTVSEEEQKLAEWAGWVLSNHVPVKAR